MDSVRFGRALGIGVRVAAKAAVRAADAAAAPALDVTRVPDAGVAGGAGARSGESVKGRVQQAARETHGTVRGLKQGGRRFGQAVWGPFARLSAVLWLEVTGVLFGMFVLVAGIEAWHGRADFLRGPGRSHEWLAVAMLLVFGYFMGSSFVRASRRASRSETRGVAQR